MLDTRFYLGPLGAMVALPETYEPVTALTASVGGLHVSLTGATTRDVYAFRRSWTWTYPALTTQQANFLRAIQQCLIRGPLYLIDPREPNRLPTDVAAGGSVSGSPVGFAPDNNSVLFWRPHTTIPSVTTTTLPSRLAVSGAVEWQAVTPGAISLELADRNPSSDGRRDIPALPGEPLVFTGWFAGPPGGQVAVTVTPYDAAGNQIVSGTVTGSSVTLDPTVWQPATAAVTTPAGTAKVRVRADALLDTPDSVYATALMVARGDDPETAPYIEDFCGLTDPTNDPTGGWRVGGGAPQVIPVEGDTTTGAAYVVPGLQSNSLTVMER